MATDKLIVESPADFHVHLRQGELSKLVTPHVRKGGFDLAYVMVSDVVETTAIPPQPKFSPTLHLRSPRQTLQ